MIDAIDQVLLRLADPTARPGLFDAPTLLSLAVVAYDIDPATVIGDTTAIYDRVDVEVPLPATSTASARMMRAGDALPWDVSATWDAELAPVAAADAVMTARLVVRTGTGGGTVVGVDVREPALDAAFAAALAPLPQPPPHDQAIAALRRAAEQTLADPPLTDAELDVVLTAVTGDRNADPRRLGRALAARDALSMRLTMSAPPDPATAPPLVLPVVVAFLVADQTASPRVLLRASIAARRAARTYPGRPPPPGAPARRGEACVCWLLPATVFDDAGWPGGTGGNAAAKRAARLAAARAWLGDQGIAIATY